MKIKVFLVPLCVSNWETLFQLHELIEIVRQSSDPEFAEMLNRIHVGKHTENDVMQIKASSDTDITGWPNEGVKLNVTNQLAGLENEKSIAKLNSEVFVIQAQDSRRDRETATYSVSIPDNTTHS